MIASVAVIVIMTLVSPRIIRQEVSLPFLSKSNSEWETRPFDSTLHQESLEEMCRNTFGGSDYLPKMARIYEKDPNCHFQALAHVDDDTVCAAVANMRRLNPNMAWLEAVRTSENYRNQGLSFRLLESMLSDASDMGYQHVLSCTIQSNKAMLRVFEKLQMTELTRIQMIKFDALRKLPGWAANDVAPCQHLLDSLDVKHLVSKSARESKWSTVMSIGELETILQDIQSKGGCGHIPGIYEVVDAQRAQEAIEQGLVWSLQDSDHPALFMFLRDKRISSLKSNWSLSVAGTHDEHLQAALWHACSATIQRKLTQEGAAGFTVAFEGVIPTDGPFCTALPLTEDACVVYGTSLNEPIVQ